MNLLTIIPAIISTSGGLTGNVSSPDIIASQVILKPTEKDSNTYIFYEDNSYLLVDSNTALLKE